MKYVEIKGSNITSRQELHELFREALELDADYGCNLDALYDVLSTYPDRVLICLEDEYILSDNLGEYADRFYEVIHTLITQEPDSILLVRNF